jgi:hypothetical protein
MSKATAHRSRLWPNMLQRHPDVSGPRKLIIVMRAPYAVLLSVNCIVKSSPVSKILTDIIKISYNVKKTLNLFTVLLVGISIFGCFCAGRAFGPS